MKGEIIRKDRENLKYKDSGFDFIIKSFPVLNTCICNMRSHE